MSRNTHRVFAERLSGVQFTAIGCWYDELCDRQINCQSLMNGWCYCCCCCWRRDLLHADKRNKVNITSHPWFHHGSETAGPSLLHFVTATSVQIQ